MQQSVTGHISYEDFSFRFRGWKFVSILRQMEQTLQDSRWKVLVSSQDYFRSDSVSPTGENSLSSQRNLTGLKRNQKTFGSKQRPANQNKLQSSGSLQKNTFYNQLEILFKLQFLARKYFPTNTAFHNRTLITDPSSQYKLFSCRKES